MRKLPLFAASAVMLMSTAGCEKADDSRIPLTPVHINLADAGLWNMFGVSGYGSSRRFVRELREPAGFGWLDKTYTGFGGVLLVGGTDPFAPLAYDLACPVECRRDVRVVMDNDNYEAVCPDCGSRYNVTEGDGRAVSGEAAAYKPILSLRRYSCIAGQLGGFLITDRY